VSIGMFPVSFQGFRLGGSDRLSYDRPQVTVKAIAKAVEGMDLEGYNKHHNLTPVVNRLIKASVGEAIENMSIAKVTGIEGTETDYQP
jgi:hypothetical protein